MRHEEERLASRATHATGAPLVREQDPYNAAEEATRTLAAAHPRPRATGRPTSQHAIAAHTPATGAPRRRVATTARPLSAADRAIVERGALASTASAPARTTDIGDIAEKPTALVDVAPRELMEALRTDVAAASTEARLPAIRAAVAPVTVITGSSLPTVRPSPIVPQRMKPRGAAHGAGLWLVGVFIVVGLLTLAFPIGERITQRPFTPHGAQLLTLRPDVAPTGPWASSAGISGLDVGGGAGPGVKAPGTAGLAVNPAATQPPAPKVQPAPAPSGILPAPVQPWPPTNPYMYVAGQPAFAASGPNGYYLVAWGQCTWWAQFKRQDENLQRMGNAQYWAGGAAARGYHVGSTPVTNATVVFQPGVQGAGGAGHVAHVEAVYPDGWFLVSEMNFYWNGGGWARVDYRYTHSGAGVSFIY